MGIELKKDNFYKILEVLSSIGRELKTLADRLREQCGPAPQQQAQLKEETDYTLGKLLVICANEVQVLGGSNANI